MDECKSFKLGEKSCVVCWYRERREGCKRGRKKKTRDEKYLIDVFGLYIRVNGNNSCGTLSGIDAKEEGRQRGRQEEGR